MIDKLLEQLDACVEAREWAKGKSWQEIYNTCHRGDWLLWLFARTNPDNLKELTLAKGHCANTVRRLMQDERSIIAVDTAIAFGEGRATREELSAAADAADIAYHDAGSAADVAYHAADAANAAAASAYYAASAAAASAAAASATTYYAARKANQLETANICRKYLPISVWNVKED